MEFEGKLAQAAQSAFPERGRACVDTFTRVKSGWESEIILFKAIFDHGEPKDLALRIYPGELSGAVGKAQGEFRTMAVLSKAGYPVPQVYTVDHSCAIFEQPWLLMDLIEGETMTRRMFTSPDPTERERMLKLFCRLFTRLHDLNWRPFVQEEYQVRLSAPNDMIDRLIARGEALMSGLPLPGFAGVWQWIKDRRLTVPGMRVSVLHWDFHPENILVRPDGQAFVIDWTSAELSDSRLDLAWTLLLTLCYRGQAWRDAILREYERQAGAAVENLAYFEVVACVRRLYSIAASVRYGAETLGMRPGAEEIMKSQKNEIRVVYALLKEHTGLNVPEVEALV